VRYALLADIKAISASRSSVRRDSTPGLAAHRALNQEGGKVFVLLVKAR
jgi:hypothetical protein